MGNQAMAGALAGLARRDELTPVVAATLQNSAGIVGAAMAAAGDVTR